MKFLERAHRCCVQIFVVFVSFEKHLEGAQIGTFHLRRKFLKLLDHLVLFDARHIGILKSKIPLSCFAGFPFMLQCAEGGT